MSGRLTGLVWESGLKSQLKPYAAVLAGFAADDGSRVRPSIARLAWMLGKTERQVQAAMADLRKTGVLLVRFPHAPGRPTTYHFDVSALPIRPPFVAKQLTFGKFSTVCTGGWVKPTSQKVKPTAPRSFK